MNCLVPNLYLPIYLASTLARNTCRWLATLFQAAHIAPIAQIVIGRVKTLSRYVWSANRVVRNNKKHSVPRYVSRYRHSSSYEQRKSGMCFKYDSHNEMYSQYSDMRSKHTRRLAPSLSSPFILFFWVGDNSAVISTLLSRLFEEGLICEGRYHYLPWIHLRI